MAHAANVVSRSLLGLDAYALWLAVFAAIVIGMGVWGPLAVVRRWLGGFAVWVMIATTAWIAWLLATRYDWYALWRQPGDGSFPFWAAVDLVIAMPISWMPLVADYSRFARRPAPAAWGTALGYFAANVTFYLLGAVILLAAKVTQEPRGFVEAIMLIAGPLALLVLLADETDEAWADLYSCAVSVQNVFPRARQWALLVGLGAASFLLALIPELTAYESFLLLIGSVFVPLFGVLASDFFVVRGRYEPTEMFRVGGPYWGPGGFRPLGLAAWAIGIATYLAISGKLGWLGLAGLPWLGASVPSFLVAFGVHGGLGRLVRAPERVVD
jgi:putative hydroxymethylpyrimidine transporter CytX